MPKKTALTLAVASSMLWSAAPALATPGVGVDSHELFKSTQDGRDFITRDITLGPGGSTGWHWHDGTLVGIIKAGTLTHYKSDCSVDGVYNAGDTVIEPSGADHVHIGRNLGPVPVVLQVTYIDPVGKPLSEDAANPGCPFG